MPTPDEIFARRGLQRALRRRRRAIAVVVAVVVVLVAGVAGAIHLNNMAHPQPNSSKAAVAMTSTPNAAPTPSVSASPTPSVTTTPASASPTPTASPAYVAGGPAPRPAITRDYIDFNAQRQAEMGAYSLAHYGSSDIHLDPKVIVLHYTCGSTYENAHATFQSDAPNMGVKPGVVSQFVIDKNGTVYQQIPLQYEGRHTVGLNYAAFGIECVQECNGSDARVVSEIMHRTPQERSLVALVRWLMYRYHISLSNVIGHGTANDSPYYRDLKGWKNDHSDWSQPQIELLRAKLK